MPTIEAPPVNRIIAVQFISLFVLSLLIFLLLGWYSGYSALLGGLISAIPNAWFVRKFFRHRGARATGIIVQTFYVGKAVTLIGAGLGFVLAFVYVEPLNAVALFLGFTLTHIAGTLALIRYQRRV
jgi:ATP synthase protein I